MKKKQSPTADYEIYDIIILLILFPIGPQNNNGQCVFDCVPAEGVIPAGGAKEITVTFAPDHPSDRYSDGVRIELFGQVGTHWSQG